MAGYLDNEKKVLSVQSSVVYGYVGNKSATFPLQLHGFDVSTVNSVQFSNHTGYGQWKGQVLNSQEALDLFDGLRMNNLLSYSHVLTGYIGSDCFLKTVGDAIRELKEKNPNLIYVCDPVMGDNGKLYVSEKLVPVYKTDIVELADVITPNQFELELLTESSISNEEEAFEAMMKLHDRGVSSVVLSSSSLGNEGVLVCLASQKHGGSGKSKRYRLHIPAIDAVFVGTGDLFASSLLAWLHKTGDLKTSIEKTVCVVQSVIKRTIAHARTLAGPGEKPSMGQMELRLVQSRNDIDNPNVELFAEEV